MAYARGVIMGIGGLRSAPESQSPGRGSEGMQDSEPGSPQALCLRGEVVEIFDHQGRRLIRVAIESGTILDLALDPAPDVHLGDHVRIDVCLHIRDLVESAALLGPLPKIYLITVSIAKLDGLSLELSPAIEEAVPRAVEAARDLVRAECAAPRSGASRRSATDGRNAPIS